MWENPNGGIGKARSSIDSHPQLVAEGAETLQAAGRVVALVTFNTTPNWALLLNASQRHCGAVLRTDFKPEQQVPSGLVVVLPLVTKDKQSAMANTRFEQSTDGAGAWCAASTAQMATTAHSRISDNFDAISSAERGVREREWEK